MIQSSTNMFLLSGNWLVDSLTVLFALVILLITWIKNRYSYWARKGVHTPPPALFFGNMKRNFFQKESLADLTSRVYKFLRSRKLDHGGMYFLTTPIYVPVDVNIIKHIMQTDFDHFVNRGLYFNEVDDPLSAHLFSLEDAKWKQLRMNLTPTFTSNKMKMMFETLTTYSDQLICEMDKSAGIESLNMKDILIRFTMDIIGSCVLGIDCKALKEPDNEINVHSKLFFEGHKGLLEHIKQMISFLSPQIMRKLKCTIVNRRLATFFMKVIKETVDYRESNNVYRKDFMHLLLQLKNRGKLEDDGLVSENGIKGDVQLTFDQLAAQAYVFFLGGFETSSTTMSFCLYELALNHAIQEKLRKEVRTVLAQHDGKLTYEAIKEMPYLDMVINETLRKYPPLPILNRICTEDYTIPGTDVVLTKGTRVWIPVLGLHHDAKYFPYPEKFGPERFTKEAKAERHPFSFLPFGEGPRSCIGMRFGLMQTKVGLCSLLTNYSFSVSKKMKLPLEMNKKCFTLATEHGIWLDFAKLN